MVKFSFLSVLGAAVGFSMVSASFAAVPRTSNMNQDIVISQSLFNALKTSAGTVKNVTLAGATVTLASDNDKLVCESSACTLNWDTTSPGYPSDAAAFEGSLYDALENWATQGGSTDPAVHKTVYVATGSSEIVVAGDPGSTDFVKCSSIIAAGSIVYKTCSMVVSDYSAGSDAALQKLYYNMLTGQSLIGPEVQALLNTVKSSSFLAPGNPANGNGVVQSTHTLYTDFLNDGWVVSYDYGYVTPVVNSVGQVLADGIELTLSGSQDASGTYSVQQVQSESYVVSQPFHGTVHEMQRAD